MNDHRSPGPWLGLALALLLLALLLLAGQTARSRDPLRLSWRAAGVAGNYAFEAESAARVGERLSRQRMRGRGDLSGRIELTLLGGGDAGVRYLIAWPEARLLDEGRAGGQGEADAGKDDVDHAGTAVRDGAGTGAPDGSAIPQLPGRPVDPHALALALPLGDPLALLAVGQSARLGALEPVGEQSCRRVDFRVGGRAYGAWWLEHRGFLPVNADSGGLHTFSAEATLWQEPRTQLPCRIRAATDLPRLGGEQPGSGEVDWRYSDWGAGGS